MYSNEKNFNKMKNDKDQRKAEKLSIKKHINRRRKGWLSLNHPL